ncbi:uncharacterized protein LOC144560815 [Carex rostrata]
MHYQIRVHPDPAQFFHSTHHHHQLQKELSIKRNKIYHFSSGFIFQLNWLFLSLPTLFSPEKKIPLCLLRSAQSPPPPSLDLLVGSFPTSLDLPVGSSLPPPLVSPRSLAETSSAFGLTSVPTSKAEAVIFNKAAFGAEEASRACCIKRKSNQRNTFFIRTSQSLFPLLSTSKVDISLSLSALSKLAVIAFEKVKVVNPIVKMDDDQRCDLGTP